jgi:ActR/RegA family two-component response regulator
MESSGPNPGGGTYIMTEKVLCVDDDPNILASYQRQFRKHFELDIAEGSEEGLKALAARGPFAVVLADMNMPGMNGIQFLSEVKKQSPDSVRMMLTGNADLKTAIEAVNTGNIFRFLTKPCPSDILTNAIQAGIEQHFLLMGERELLKNTLTGCVKILSEILSMVNRAAFSRADRIRGYVEDITREMQLPDLWQYEVGAMLSQIGCITLPPLLIEKIAKREKLTVEEQAMFSQHPNVAHKLLSKIPRLGPVAQMIEGQLRPFKTFVQSNSSPTIDPIALGSQIIKTALDFDQLTMAGKTYLDALNELAARPDNYNPAIVATLKKLLACETVQKKDEEMLHICVKDVQLGMIAAEDILAKDGFLLVPKDHEITYPVLLLLRNMSRGGSVSEPFRVRLPKNKAEPIPAT